MLLLQPQSQSLYCMSDLAHTSESLGQEVVYPLIHRRVDAELGVSVVEEYALLLHPRTEQKLVHRYHGVDGTLSSGEVGLGRDKHVGHCLREGKRSRDWRRCRRLRHRPGSAREGSPSSHQGLVDGLASLTVLLKEPVTEELRPLDLGLVAHHPVEVDDVGNDIHACEVVLPLLPPVPFPRPKPARVHGRRPQHARGLHVLNQSVEVLLVVVVIRDYLVGLTLIRSQR
mmetsp:Transcript_30665/g.69195  ORF Transcript_30665/g.69195 Transcript_30665/m.69195 type:complete len:228 (-) Transcript_30665:994-1677(-)